MAKRSINLNKFKGTYIRKTIVVRISVSRDKILKNRTTSNPLLNKENIEGIRPNSEDKNIKRKNKNDNRKNNMINNIQWKNDYQLKTPERSKEKNNIYSNEKMNKNEKNSLITISDYKKNDKAQDNKNKKNITYNPSKITSVQGLNKNPYNKPKINNNQNNNNKKTASNIYTYELKKPLLNPKDIFSRYDNKTEIQKNIINNNNSKMKNKDYKNYRAYTNVNSPNTIHRKNNSKYSLKINEKTKLNQTKFKDKNYFKNTYTKSNHHKNPSFDNEYKYKYETRTSKKDAYLKKKIDNEILRKGITTVIQHYLGVREKLDNYGLKKNLPN